MIGVVIFYIHVLVATWMFVRSWQEGGMTDGFLGVAFIGVVFTVGWTFASFILKLFIAPEGFAVWCDRNTLSLILLTILEFVLYRVFFWDYILGTKKAATNQSPTA